MAAVSTKMPTLSRVRLWDTQHLTDAATRWTNAARVLDDTFTTVEREIGIPWKGEAAEAAMRQAALDRVKVVAVADALRKAADVASRGASQLADAKQAVLSAVARAQEDGFEVAEDLSVTDPDFFSPVEAVRAAREALAQSHANQIGTKALKLAALDQEIATSITDAAANVAQLSFDDTSRDCYPPAEDDLNEEPAIPHGKTPKEVNEWWESLSEEQQGQLLRDSPEELGGLKGVPVETRSLANIAVMEQDIARGENGTEALSSEEMTRYENAKRTSEGLEAMQDNAWGDPETYLLIYEPEAYDGQGRAAIAIGNPDTADNTAVLVPGTGNSVRDGWLSGDDAVNVYNETMTVDPSKKTSVVAWMGYDAPDSPADPRVAQTGLAREGGALLASDVNALEVTNIGDSHVTAIGHSYGSTTVADAAAGYGMRADDVVLVGSPGTDLAQSAADFSLPEGGNVFVGSESKDPVTHLGVLPQVDVPGTGNAVGLGNDPAVHGYGSTRFKAEAPGLHQPFHYHTQYFEPGSESLYSIADIASGQGHLLQEHGMTASHRSSTTILGKRLLPGPIGDPESLRPATDGHFH